MSIWNQWSMTERSASPAASTDAATRRSSGAMPAGTSGTVNSTTWMPSCMGVSLGVGRPGGGDRPAEDGTG